MAAISPAIPKSSFSKIPCGRTVLNPIIDNSDIRKRSVNKKRVNAS
jgi:hypothetical protein